MGELALLEQAAPTTPSSGVIIYPTVATPSITKIKDDGGNDLTVAVLERAQTFTQRQTLDPNDAVALITADRDMGTAAAQNLLIGRNSNGSTPAPGALRVRRANGDNDNIYPDDSGVWRTLNTAAPTNATFAGGTVVGSQTSHISYKDVLGAPVSDAEALEMICTAAADVCRFVYRDRRYNGEEFSGLVLDGEELHRYGMDADPEHAAGKSLNLINAVGDLFLAIRSLAERVATLERAAK